MDLDPNDPLFLPASQATPFPIEPVSADVLCGIERKRRDGLKRQGSCSLGCREVDEYVLRGGFERGCVLGISSEDEDFGVRMALQVVARTLCAGFKSGVHERAMIISTQSAGAVARRLRDAAVKQIKELGVGVGPMEVLARVEIVRVFDVEGLWEAVGDLDALGSPQGSLEPRAEAAPQSRPDEGSSKANQDGEALDVDSMEPKRRLRDEIPDSEDEYSPLGSPEPVSHKSAPPTEPELEPEPEPRPGPEADAKSKILPSIILITHFSTLLTTLFTHTEKSAAHTTLQLLSSHLRYLTRNLSSSPLVLITNTTSGTSSHQPPDHKDDALAPHSSSPRRPPSHLVTPNSSKRPKPLDPTLRSVFNNPPSGLYAYGAPMHRNKPSFGLVFTQFLDLHLLCTRVVRERRDAELEIMGRGGEKVWVVECVLDEIGVWEGQTGRREMREGRWGPVDVLGESIVDARMGRE